MTKRTTTETKTIAVIGAARATGGGLARAILADPKGGYACRAITRTPDSIAARALADRGATVVRADLDDADSLVAAFEGAYGAFCLTSFFEDFDAERSDRVGRAESGEHVLDQRVLGRQPGWRPVRTGQRRPRRWRPGKRRPAAAAVLRILSRKGHRAARPDAPR